MTQISLRFEIEDVTLGEKFFRKVVVSESQFDLSRFDIVELVGEDLKTSVLKMWRFARATSASSVDKS